VLERGRLLDARPAPVAEGEERALAADALDLGPVARVAHRRVALELARGLLVLDQLPLALLALRL
jgi:hypothetical protein